MTLEQLRIRVALSQKQLADKVGVAPLTIFNWENGINEPRITYIRALAEALEVSIAEVHEAIAATKKRQSS